MSILYQTMQNNVHFKPFFGNQANSVFGNQANIHESSEIIVASTMTMQAFQIQAKV